MNSSRTVRAFLGLVVLLTAAAPGRAQLTPGGGPPDLVTDRPDQTESAEVVPAGFLQLETGVSGARDEGGGETVRELSGPGTLVRIGLGGRAELRVGWEGWIEERVEPDAPGGVDRSTSGIGDGELGIKVKLREESGSRPQMALLAGVTLPVGDEDLTSDELDPSIRLAFAHTLSERLGFAYNLGAERFTEGETYTRFLATAALGAALTERLGGFVELFGEAPERDAPGGSQLSLDGGFTYLLRPNLQLDGYAGAGLTDDAPDWIAGAGVSVRWPR